MKHGETARKRYEDLATGARDAFLRRARYCAEETVPAVLPEEGVTDIDALPLPYGFGARVCVTLASNLTSVLYPPGVSAFRFNVPPEILLEAQQQAVPPAIEHQLALLEDLVNGEIENLQWRTATNLAFLNLIIAGNYGEYQRPDGSLKIFRLDQYVVNRDPNGVLLEAIIRELVHPRSLPEGLSGMVGDQAKEHGENVGLYTVIQKVPGKARYHVWQELDNQMIPRSKAEYDAKYLPYRFPRWASVLGEDYGRSKVEEHLGDFRAINGLTKALIDGGALASRHVWMVRSGARNILDRLSKAENGDVISGDPEGVGMLQFQNQTGLQVTQSVLQELKQEVASAFAMQSAVRRDAERVTAFEIQMMAKELEGTLGGVYSMLADSVQGPRLTVLIQNMMDEKKLPDLGDNVDPQPITGLEALGREQEAARVGQALQMLQGLPPEVMDYINWQSLLTKVFNGLNLPDSVNNEQVVQQIQQQRAMQQMAQQVAGGQAGQQMAAEAAAGMAEQAQEAEEG